MDSLQAQNLPDKRSLSENGFALLEAAFMFVLLISFLAVGTSVGQYGMFSSQLDRVMDKALFDSNLIPYEISVDSTDGIGKELNQIVNLRTSEVNARLDEVMNAIIADLEGLRGKPLTKNSIEIEASYVDIEIDPRDGTVKKHTISLGRPLPGENFGLKSDIVSKVKDPVAEQVTQMLSLTGNDGAFIHAAPSAHYGGGATSENYSPRAMMLVVRVAWDIRDEAWVKFGLDLFQEPLLQRTKIIPVRGDITL